MSNYPLVKFVDSPAVGATVRLDLNDGSATAPRRVEADIDFGVTAIEGEPDAVGQAFGFRSPRLTVQVKGTKANALAFVSALSKEMLRQTNWLMFQLDASTSPRWLKTYRTGYQSLSLEQVFGNTTTGGTAAGHPDVWRIEVPLVADGLAYGARQTLSGIKFEQTISTDLDATFNALTAALPTLQGDAPTSLRVSLDTVTSLVTGEEWMIGCVAGKSSMLDPAFDIGTGDGYTAGTGTSAGSSNAAYVGGTYRTVTIAANDGGAGSSLADRLSGTVTTTLPQGRYKVLLRYEASVTAGTTKTYLFRYTPQGAEGNTVSVSVATTLGTTQQGWVDLGDIPFPVNVGDLPSDSGLTMPTTTSFKFTVGTSDNTSGTVRLDAFKFIPVTGSSVTRATMAKTQFVAINPSFQVPVWDGDTESLWITNSVTVTSDMPTRMSGSFPVADPGAEKNLLVAVALKSPNQVANATGIHTSRKAQSTATVSYFPRYLHIGDGT